MAQKHIILRYAQVEHEYLEMVNILNDLNKGLENNEISIEYYNEKAPLIAEEIDTLKTQYLFWSEAIFELNKPNKKDHEFDRTTASWYNVIKTKTKESLKNNDINPLENLKDLISQGKI